jgi:protocatechuate 3,4-dioxygenase beta subunit
MAGEAYRQGDEWWSTVTVTVVDDDWSPVADTTVVGTWKNGFSGPASCTTDSSGQCSVTTPLINVQNKQVIFVVDDMEHDIFAFYPNRNLDPDGNPRGRSLKVVKPNADVLPEDGSGPAGSGPALHVGNLEGAATANGTEWQATVTVTILDAEQNPVPNALVSGSWSYWATDNCTTDVNGQCSIVGEEYESVEAEVMSFTVENVTHPDFSYNASANTDPNFDSDGTTISVHEPGIIPMFVADLDGSTSANGSKWRTTVTVTVLDSGQNPLAGTTVYGTWSYGDSKNCTTGANGQCSFVSSEVEAAQVNNISFTIDNVTHPEFIYAYSAASNSDPDGDSDGTTISVDVPVATTMSVADMDGVTSVNGSKWRATVTISVLDAGLTPVAGAEVEGLWSNGREGECTTDAHGLCSLASSEVESAEVDNLSFTIDDIDHAAPLIYAYAAANNSDPDGDSDGTTISIDKPGATTIAVADLDAVNSPNRTKWRTTVTISVLDANGTPVEDAEVEGTWSYGDSKRLHHRRQRPVQPGQQRGRGGAGQQHCLYCHRHHPPSTPGLGL